MCVCRILFYSGLLKLVIFTMKLRWKEFPAVIINYHSFVQNYDQTIEVHPTVTHRIDDFNREIRFLKNNFDVVSLDQVVNQLKSGEKFKKPTVAITVDDGFKDNYDLLFPVLRKYKATVTIFLTTGVIGTQKRLWVGRLEKKFLETVRKEIRLDGIFKGVNFDISSIKKRRKVYLQVVSRLKNIDTGERDRYLQMIEKKLGTPRYDTPTMLNWDQIREMHRANIHFGAHTVNHPILTNIPLEEGKKEILDSKLKIEQELGQPIRHFAFPNGRERDFNEELRQYCKDIGFESVSSCSYGYNDSKDDVYSLKRIGSEVPISLYALNVYWAFHVKEENQ